MEKKTTPSSRPHSLNERFLCTVPAQPSFGERARGRLTCTHTLPIITRVEGHWRSSGIDGQLPFARPNELSLPRLE